MAFAVNKKAFCVLEFAKNWVNCDGATEVSDHVPRRTTYGQNNSWAVHEIPAEWLPVRCETKRPSRPIGWECQACARNVCQEPSEVNSSHEPGIAGRTETWRDSLPIDMLLSAVSSWLLRSQVRKSRRDLWITLYMKVPYTQTLQHTLPILTENRTIVS